MCLCGKYEGVHTINFCHLNYYVYIFIFLQIERDTQGKLQCHPYPHEYVDPSKQCSHNAFFMGLQRKQGEIVQEGQQFDIRGTVDEFRHSVNMYMFWKPGMEIYVSHVRRKQIPLYVFPNGYKRSRASRIMNQQPVGGVASVEKPIRKRKDERGHEERDSPQRRQSISPGLSPTPSPLSHGSVSPYMSRREVSPLEGEPESVVTNEEIGLERTGPVLQGSSSEVDSLSALDKVPGDKIQVFEVSVPKLFPLPLL